jgi:hypothetical protein
MYIAHILVVHMAAATSSTDSPSSSDRLLSELAWVIGSAIIGGACTYVVSLLLARRNPRKQLSWDASTDRGLVAVSSTVRDNVKITYKGKDAGDLVAVRCRVTNTGNTVIKNEELRFAFPEETQIIEGGFSPQPERELRASRIESQDLKATEYMFSIGQLEVGQEVSFEFMATGQRAEDWKLHSFNEQGDVEFRQREAGRARDEQEHVRPVIVIATLFLITTTLIESVEQTDFFLNQFVASIGALIDLGLSIALIPHVLPVTRIVQRLVALWLHGPDPTTNVTIQGGDARVVASSGTVGSVHFGDSDADRKI